MSNKMKTIDNILYTMDREIKLAKILDVEVDQEFIDKHIKMFIEELLKDLEKYE